MLVRWLLRSIPILILLALISSVAYSNTTHTTSGTGGSHSSTTHSNNPSHIYIRVRAPLSSAPPSTGVSRAGRYHDRCTATVCYPARGGDWALDISANGGTIAKLYLDYAGWGSGADPSPDNNRTITIRARVAENGNFSGSDSACYWQRLEVLADYYGTNGQYYPDRVIGYYWFAHLTLTSWRYPNVGTIIGWNASRANPYGSGTIRYISGVEIGDVYGGSGACSSGAHVHVEFYSTHAWGFEYEWHSISRDGYSGLAGYTDHIHFDGANYNHSPRRDSVTQGSTTLGFLGGGSTLFWMRDNPYYSDH